MAVRITGRRFAVAVTVLLVLALAGAVGLRVYKKQQEGREGENKAPVTLEFAPADLAAVESKPMSRWLPVSGTLTPVRQAVVKSKVSGEVRTLTVREGDAVHAGQALARIDTADLEAKLIERQGQLESARAQLALAEKTLSTNQKLLKQNFISQNAFDSSESNMNVTRGSVKSAEANVRLAQNALKDAVATAPLSGIVAKRHVLPGEKVAIEQPLLTIVDLRVLELAGTVGTHEVASLSPGMPVQVKVEGVAKPVAGRIARIAPAAEPGTRSIGVTVELANPDERLRAGQYAVAQASLPDDKQRLALPLTAIGSTAGQSHVWVIEQGKLARRAVTTGRVDEAQARVEVVSGLGADAQVLAARFDNLREGAAAVVTAVRASAPAATVQR